MRFVIAGLTLLVAAASALVASGLTRSYMIRQAAERIDDVMLESRALHQYVQQNLHPAMYELKQEGRMPEDFYAPELLSSSYIARNLYRHYNEERKRAGLPEITYRMAAIDPRNPVNEATPFERSLIEQFNADPSLHEYREIMEAEDGTRVLLCARPFLRTEERCLTCHGDPASAPQELRQRYNWTGGFNRKVGDIVAIETIRSPLTAEFTASNVALLIFLSIAALVGILFFLNSRLRHLIRGQVEALAESEQRFRALFEQAADAIVLIDLETLAIVDFNDLACRNLGYSRAEFQALQLEDLEGDSQCESLADHVTRIREQGGDVFETCLRTKEGDVRHFQITIRAVAVGGREYCIGIWHDITQRICDEQNRAALEEQLRQAQKMEAVGQLAGGIAHDFNNILTAILGNVELALMNVDAKKSPVPAMSQELHEIERSAQRAARLTRHLLAYSRRQVSRPELLDLNQVLRETETMLRRLISEDISLKINAGSDLHVVHADAGQIEQVLLNLVVNARDAMPDGGELTIETANMIVDETAAARHNGARPGLHVMLSVRDTGSGMDAETQRRAFDPFFSTKPVGKGTGLGLATTYGIVAQTGGHIVVESEVGQGTTFRIYLPTVMASVRASMPSASDQASAPGGTETILIVEDDHSVRDLTVQLLTDVGYTVLAAEGGRQALQLAEEHHGPIDLLVTDVIMPEMNGRRVSDQLTADRPGLRTLFVSGYTSSYIAQHGVLEKDVHFLEKPFSRRALLRAVRTTLEAEKPVLVASTSHR